MTVPSTHEHGTGAAAHVSVADIVCCPVSSSMPPARKPVSAHGGDGGGGDGGGGVGDGISGGDEGGGGDGTGDVGGGGDGGGDGGGCSGGGGDGGRNSQMQIKLGDPQKDAK